VPNIPKPRASLNVRLSKAAGAANVSKEGMIKDLRDLCRAEGFQEVALHVDDGVSGSVRDRPGLVAWLDDAREGRADVLVAWHVDRMSREGLPVAAAILDVVEGKDPLTGKPSHAAVRLMDVKGLDSNDGEGFRFRFVMQAELARAERERMRDRARAKDRRLRLAGRWTGGPVPHGYQPQAIPTGGWTLALNDDEAAALREAAGRLLAGDRLWEVTRWMNAHGTPPRRAKAWGVNTLRRTLTSEHLLGRVVVDGTVQRDEEGHALTKFPAVLDLATALAVRGVLKSTPPEKPRGRHPVRLLARVVTCATCGALLTITRGTNMPPTYRCPSRMYGKAECAHPITVAAEPLEKWVEGEYLAGAGRLARLQRVVTVTDTTRLAEVEDALAATLAKLGQAATPETFARLQALQKERDELAAIPKTSRIDWVPTGETQAQFWARSGTDDRRALLTEAIEVLEVGPGRGGRKGLDPARVNLIWREGDHDPDYY
jgi:site-specific DNA recombinase